MLPGDRRAAWDANVMPDPRVTHLWDEQRLTGRWFAQHLHNAQDIIWDGYLLYGPDAKWETLPEPLIGSSIGTVIGSREELQQQIIPLLQQ
jgi:hypothetical protein